jgi:hypothetical protein
MFSDGEGNPMSDCNGDRKIESSFERAVSPARFHRWIKNQEGMIDQARSVASKADAAGDFAKSLEALQLAMRRQDELIALRGTQCRDEAVRKGSRAEQGSAK